MEGGEKMLTLCFQSVHGGITKIVDNVESLSCIYHDGSEKIFSGYDLIESNDLISQEIKNYIVKDSYGKESMFPRNFWFISNIDMKTN